MIDCGDNSSLSFLSRADLFLIIIIATQSYFVFSTPSTLFWPSDEGSSEGRPESAGKNWHIESHFSGEHIWVRAHRSNSMSEGP